MRLHSYAKSDIGMRRNTNEDYYLIRDNESKETLLYGKLYIVCDGMGGHQAGEVASKMAAEEFCKVYFSNELEATKNIKDRIREALSITNSKIYNYSSEYPDVKGMGTTIVGLVVKGNKAYIFNVGDSRCYLLKRNTILQISEDHSLVNELVKAKVITEEEAKNSSKKNILTRALGIEKTVEPSINEIELYGGEIFLLCTDGLYNMVRDSEIRYILEASEGSSSLERLIDLANERGGVDNITAIIVKVERAKLYKALWKIFAPLALLSIFFLFLARFLSYKQITVSVIPDTSLILLNGKSFIGKCSFLINSDGPIILNIEKEGFLKETVTLWTNSGNLFYSIDGNTYPIQYRKIEVALKKLVFIKLVDEDNNNAALDIKNFNVLIDGEKLDFSDSNAENFPIPISTGYHKILVKSIDGVYDEKLLENVIIDSSTDQITIGLKQIPLISLNTSPEGGDLYIFDSSCDCFVYFCNTMEPVNYNKIKNKKIMLLKDDNSFTYFTELTIFDEIPSKVIKLDNKGLKILINSDVGNAEFYDYFGNKLLKIKENGISEYLVKREVKDWLNLKGKAYVNGAKVEVSATFNVVQNKVNLFRFYFDIFEISGKNIKLKIPDFGLSKDLFFTGIVNEKYKFTIKQNEKKTFEDLVRLIRGEIKYYQDGKIIEYFYNILKEE
ncbi:MAG: Stp1/IreP family PP2C-type Ser/Thr phosphatase [Candidatus Aenigmatarchaeota archaeon]